MADAKIIDVNVDLPTFGAPVSSAKLDRDKIKFSAIVSNLISGGGIIE